MDDPIRAEDVTSEWLTATLQAHGCLGEGTVRAFTITELAETTSVLGDLVRFELELEGAPPEAPRSVIAKFAVVAEENRALAMILGHYRREVGFYRELAGEASLPVPACYHARFDPETHDFVLLLEDLADLELGDQLLGCSRDDAVRSATCVARMHARWWEDERLDTIEWLPSLDDEVHVVGVPPAFDAGWANARDYLGVALTSSVVELGDRFSAAIPELLRRLSEPPRTLVHGDFRLDNLFFGPGPTRDLRVVDMQLVMSARGPYDIAYLCSQSLPIDERREYEEDLVRGYWGALTEAGVEGYGLDQCWEDYRLATLFCFVYPVVLMGGLDLGNPRSHELERTIFERSTTAITELDAMELLPEP